LFSIEERRLWGDLITALQYLKGDYMQEGNKLFAQIDNNRGRRSDPQLKEGRFSLDIRGKFFTERVVRCWIRLMILNLVIPYVPSNPSQSMIP